MTEVIGVRFKKVGKVYYFDPVGKKFEENQAVVVETSRGLEYGEVAMPNRGIADSMVTKPLKKVVRAATEEDTRAAQSNARLEAEAFRVCEDKIAKHKLDMKLVSVEYTFDHSKILFYFSADGRIDFRELVKDLASVFRTRIELRQIGVRDEAKMIGGLGICGRPLCCSSFLEDFQPVSINMAKEQGLSLNPTKISGTCGRLMCCLKYESDTYHELLKTTPPAGSLVDTPQGRGTVMDVSLLKGCCRVRLQNSSDAPVVMPCSECTCLRAGREKTSDVPVVEESAPASAARSESAPQQQRPQQFQQRAPQPQKPRPPKFQQPRPQQQQQPRPQQGGEEVTKAADNVPVQKADGGEKSGRSRGRSRRGGAGRSQNRKPQVQGGNGGAQQTRSE